jgi:arylsulfatase A-like enzyme
VNVRPAPSPLDPRRRLTLGIVALAAMGLSPSTAPAARPDQAPNVIFIATDDLNAWVGPLHAPIQAKTPHLDRLAARGVTFRHAQACGGFCAPSRSALITGRHPSTTGAYTTQIYWRDRPELRPLQVAFQQAGYQTYGTGKVFHHPAGFVDRRGWTDFHVRTQAQRESGWPVDSWRQGAPLPTPLPFSRFTRERNSGTDRTFMEYAPLPDEVEKDMADTQQTDWVLSVLRRRHEQPFFIALGLSAPHFPNYAPQRYYDLYPLDEIKLPPIKEDDTADLPPAVRKFYDQRKATIHDKLDELGLMKEVLRAYLACISYADAQVGRVLDALEASPERDNTIVIFWSDQGYHHGEKGQWGKHTLWRETAHIPFIWAGPGIARPAAVDATVSAIDTYPTLVDLCRLAPDPGLEGRSLADVLRDPAQARDRDVLLCDIKPGGFAVVNQQWRYIRYADGTEELYHLVDDPNEWHNLAPAGGHQAVIARMRAGAPRSFAPAGPETNQLRHITAGEDFRWEPRPPGGGKARERPRRNPGAPSNPSGG